MKITLISVGKMKEDAGYAKLDDFYRGRIKPFAQFEVVELREKNSIEQETESIIKAIPRNNCIIALRETGKKFDSIGFSELIRKERDRAKDITFCIGGAYGFSSIGEDLSLSIAPWTLPHQLARIVLIEQIYRGLSILNGSKYHHG